MISVHWEWTDARTVLVNRIAFSYGLTEHWAWYEIPNWNSCRATTTKSKCNIGRLREWEKYTRIEIETKTKALTGSQTSCAHIENNRTAMYVVCVRSQRVFLFVSFFNEFQRKSAIWIIHWCCVFAKQFNKSTLKYPLISIKWNYNRVLFRMTYD